MSIREGMWFVWDGPEKLKTKLQDGRKQGHLKDLWVLLIRRWAYGRCSRIALGVILRFRESSTGAKHLHWGPLRIPECM